MADNEMPKKLGRYEIVGELGKGAMGIVYEGYDPNIGRRVAIKTARKEVLEASGMADELMERFLREAQAAGKLNHPNIITIYDAGKEGDMAYIAMEYLDGGDLDDQIKRKKRMDVDDIANMTASISEALACAHKKGIVHRDIKPANIMTLPNGDIKVADFGIAHVSDSDCTQEGSMIGTPHYMSPEQFMGQKVDGRSDLFSVAIMTYQLLTGEQPFPGDAISAVMHNVLKTEPVEPKELNFAVSESLSKVVMKALSKSPNDRYQSGDAMAAAIRESIKPNPDPAILQLTAAAATEATVVSQDAAATSVRGAVGNSAAAGRLMGVQVSIPETEGQPDTEQREPSARGHSESLLGMPFRLARTAANKLLSVLNKRPRPSDLLLSEELGTKCVRGAYSGDPDGDAVDCSVFAPPAVREGDTFMVQAFAHLAEQVDDVVERAKEFDDNAGRRAMKSLAARVARGSQLVFELTMPGLSVDDPVQTLVWNGRPDAVQFGVGFPDDADSQIGFKAVVGKVIVRHGDVPIGHIKFRLEILPARDRHAVRKPQRVGDASRYSMAFVSYASGDREKVLPRVQMLKALGIRYFQDIIDIDPGARWERELYRQIDECDLFLLFWSHEAKQSQWVRKELGYALDRKGQDDFAPPEVCPIILEGPPIPEPWEEVAHLHFSDQLLYFMQGETN